MEDYEIVHFGVKGMKWGVVRGDAPGSTKTRASADATRAKEYKTAARTGPGKTDALSTKELKALVERMNLEQQYSKLSENSKSTNRKNAEAFVQKHAKTLAFGLVGKYAKSIAMALFLAKMGQSAGSAYGYVKRNSAAVGYTNKQIGS